MADDETLTDDRTTGRQGGGEQPRRRGVDSRSASGAHWFNARSGAIDIYVIHYLFSDGNVLVIGATRAFDEGVHQGLGGLQHVDHRGDKCASMLHAGWLGSLDGRRDP
jgi:hypothetical protein